MPPLPDVAPQLATPADAAPDGAGWIHEIKYDGYRLLCRIEKGVARLISRNGKDWSARFPSVVSAAASLDVGAAILDGEVAIVRADGTTSFQDLQNSLSGEPREGSLVYFAFDLLHLDGTDWRPEPLVGRKARLAALLAHAGSTLRYCDHVEGNGPQFLEAACGHGLEGVISKKRDAPYRPGRGRDWLKIKCKNVEEFVVGGYTEPGGSRRGIGALLVGAWEDDELRFAGRVGTGFSDRQLIDIAKRLQSIERSDPPFVDAPTGRLARGMHWVDPQLVAQVAFAEWTNEGLLRHPAFEGFRDDRPASEVVMPARRRRAGPADAPADGSGEETAAPPNASPRKHAPARSPGRTHAGRASGRRSGVTAEVLGIPITNPDKVMYPADGITKLEIARYYEAVAEYMVPCVAERPLTLVRCPNGIDGCFYQKHIEGALPDVVYRVPIRESDEMAEYAVVDSGAGVVALAQLGVLEIHTWGSTRADLEHPDKFTMDFDPDPGVPWIRVVEAALEVRGFLGELGLTSFLKTTGGKGLHVVVPVRPKLDWDDMKEFTRSVAAAVARDNPGRYTLSISKDKRKGRILIDYLRNGRGATAIEAYSTRARPGATVSVPIHWDELAAGVRSDSFNVRNLPERLSASRDDPWAEFGATRQSIERPMLRAVGMDV